MLYFLLHEYIQELPPTKIRKFLFGSKYKGVKLPKNKAFVIYIYIYIRKSTRKNMIELKEYEKDK